MNKPPTLSIIVFAPIFTCAISAAADRIDSPGPGYRQQIEAAFRKATKDVPTPIQVGPSIIRVVPSGFPTPELPSPQWSAIAPTSVSPTFALPRAVADAFSEPIRITIDNSVKAK